MHLFLVSIFNTWFTYLRNSFNHDHIKKKSLKGTFSFYLFGLFKWIHFSLYRYWKFIIWLIIAYYCFYYFSRIGDYVLNWSNTSFPCFMNFKARGFKVHKTWKTIVEPIHKSNTCVPAETAHSQDSLNSITSPGQTQLAIIKTLTMFIIFSKTHAKYAFSNNKY